MILSDPFPSFFLRAKIDPHPQGAPFTSQCTSGKHQYCTSFSISTARARRLHLSAPPAANVVSLILPCLENPEGTSRQPAALFCPVVPGLQVFETRHGVRLPAQAILVVRVQNELPEGAGGLFLLGW